MMANLLVIAYYYPPFGGAGVQRTVKFTKYLPGFSWKPAVLTVKPGYARLSDPTLLADIPEDASIWRTPALLLPRMLPWRLRKLISSWLLLTDEQLGWYPFAIRQAEKIIQDNSFQAIYSTSGPFTDHLIGLRLAEKTGLPWIADFRDPWVGNFASRFPTRMHQALAVRLERKVVQAARRVVVVSEPMRQALLSRQPDISPERIVTIQNGYDPQDFIGIEPYDFPPGRMTIVYSGSFYAQGLTPREFLQALNVGLYGSLIPRHQIQVYLVGNIGQAAQDLVSELGLTDIVHATGYLTHRESLSYLLGADLLLLIVGSGPGSEHVLTGKIFEYLAAHKPILALAPQGAAADMIHQTKAGYVIHPQDSEEIRTQLVSIFDQWNRKGLGITPDERVIKSLDRRVLTARLAGELDNIANIMPASLMENHHHRSEGEYKAEIDRIKGVYQGAYKSETGNRSYTWHPLNPVSVYYRQTLEKALVYLFRDFNLDPPSSRVLDLGCGEGNFLRFLVSLRALPANLFGLDLMPYRIESAATISPPAVNFLVGEGGYLPYEAGCFDIVSQFTVFSSLLNKDLRLNVAAEMYRVLKPGGYILWYDMRITRQKTTRGISHQEIIDLFPSLKFMAMRSLHADRVTRFAKRSLFLGDIWDHIPGLRKTHLLALLRKPPSGGKED